MWLIQIGVIILQKLKNMEDEIEKLKACKNNIKYPDGIEIFPFQELNRRERQLILERKQLEISTKYSELNPSFLSMGQQKEHDGNTVRIPRFSVYSTDNPTFSIHFRRWYDSWDMVSKTKSVLGGNGRIEIVIYAPKLFSDQLIKSLEFNKYSNPSSDGSGHASEYLFQNIPKKVTEKYVELGNVCVLGTQFNGILPDTTLDKIKEYEQTNGGNIYIIAESKPEDWTTKLLPTCDPIIVGVLEDKCYLIDHFNTTQLEDYVRREFIS